MGFFKSDKEKLFDAIENENIKKVKLILENANKKNKTINVNEKNSEGLYLLLKAIYHNNIEIVKLLIEYSDNHNIILELNKKDKNGNYPLLLAIFIDNIDMVKLLMEYADKNNIILKLDEKRRKGDYPLYWAIDNNNIEIVKLLMIYSNKKNIVLKLNEKNKYGNYPILEAIYNNNIEIVRLLMSYAYRHNIILELNEKSIIGNNPLSMAISNDNVEIVKLLIKYANYYHINLENIDNNNGENCKINMILQNKKQKIGVFPYNCVEKKPENISYKTVINRIKNKKNRKEIEKIKDNSNVKTPTLVIATNNFDGERYDHLDIRKNEFLIVTEWKCDEEGWVYGHRKNNEKEKGLFPKVFIKIYEVEKKDKNIIKNEIIPEYRIEFENKIKQLRSLNEMKIINANTFIFLNRNNIFNDAFNNIMNKSPEELKKKLKINYIGEEGIDAGGLVRDFFYQISKEIGNPNYSFFQYSHDNSYELEINENSGIIDSDHLKYFRFIGRIIGLAVFHKQYLAVSFTLLFYKELLNIPLEISDLKYVDEELFKNLNQLKENKGAENLYLTFEVDIIDCFGNRKTIELKPNGANIDVTDSNKNEYIDLIVKNKLYNRNDNEQLEAIKEGFYEIIPENINTLINELDLKFLISGISEINVDDWQNNTDYEGYDKDDITIINFWKCVRNFSNENRSKLLLFGTGNSQVPVTGFKDLHGSNGIQHFKLKKIGKEDNLPISHTCFNCIDLPPYTSYTQMKQKLLLAISEGMGGFSIE